MAKTVLVKLKDPYGPPYRNPDFTYSIKGNQIARVELEDDIKAKLNGGKLVMADDDEKARPNDLVVEDRRRWQPVTPAWKVKKNKAKAKNAAAADKRKAAAGSRAKTTGATGTSIPQNPGGVPASLPVNEGGRSEIAARTTQAGTTRATTTSRRTTKNMSGGRINVGTAPSERKHASAGAAVTLGGSAGAKKKGTGSK